MIVELVRLPGQFVSTHNSIVVCQIVCRMLDANVITLMKSYNSIFAIVHFPKRNEHVLIHQGLVMHLLVFVLPKGLANLIQ